MNLRRDWKCVLIAVFNLWPHQKSSEHLSCAETKLIHSFRSMAILQYSSRWSTFKKKPRKIYDISRIETERKTFKYIEICGRICNNTFCWGWGRFFSNKKKRSRSENNKAVIKRGKVNRPRSLYPHRDIKKLSEMFSATIMKFAQLRCFETRLAHANVFRVYWPTLDEPVTLIFKCVHLKRAYTAAHSSKREKRKSWDQIEFKSSRFQTARPFLTIVKP